MDEEPARETEKEQSDNSAQEELVIESVRYKLRRIRLKKAHIWLLRDHW